MSIRSYWIIGVILAICTACGSGRPGKLKYQFDDMYIARVPVQQKQIVLDTQQSWSSARLEWHEATQIYNGSATQVKVARNEAKKAKLEENSVKAMQKGAEKTGDLTQMNEATLKLRAAKLAHKAAKRKVAYEIAWRKYLAVQVDYTEDLMHAEEARYEQSKARMAQKNNIQPKGFNPANFQKQFENRSRYAQRTKARMDKSRAKAERVKKEWQALIREAEIAGRAAQNAGGSLPGNTTPFNPGPSSSSSFDPGPSNSPSSSPNNGFDSGPSVPSGLDSGPSLPSGLDGGGK